jgi:hypothetical protein
MRIQGTISAYLWLGFAWAHAHHIAQLVAPGAINTAGTDLSLAIHWINYSLGMTRLGCPEIVPIDSVAHTLCSAEAVTGQLYLAVLIARLVSMHVSAEEQSNKSVPQNENKIQC